MAPSSANANAPQSESAPAASQMPNIHSPDGSSRAIEPGTIKTPEPMIVPTTIATESHNPSRRESSGEFIALG